MYTQVKFTGSRLQARNIIHVVTLAHGGMINGIIYKNYKHRAYSYENYLQQLTQTSGVEATSTASNWRVGK